jgi:aminoglycoside phosphotransferase (APT) family kinase protein
MTTLELPETTTTGGVDLRRVGELLDAHVMGPRLRAAVGATGRAPCSVLDAKYEPGVRCTVLYRVGDLLVRGDLLADGTGGTETTRPVVPPGLRLCRFPDDPDLPGLAAAVHPATLREALQTMCPGTERLLHCRVDLLRYRPGRRATLAVQVRGRSGAARRLVVKSYHDSGKAAAVATEAGLLDATVDAAAPLRFAPVRAHLPELSLVVQEHVPGVRLDELLRIPGRPAARALRRAAVALAALHAQPPISRRTRPARAELDRFLSRASRVAAVDPATGSALTDLGIRLVATSRDMPPGQLGLVHGDCKPDQFLLRGDRDVVLLDLDSCGLADPAGDVGTFLATLRQRTVRQRLTRAAIHPSAAWATGAAVFLDEYLRAAGATGDSELGRRIAWYEAVALERKALRCFARAPRSPVTSALVAEGHAVLDRLGDRR